MTRVTRGVHFCAWTLAWTLLLAPPTARAETEDQIKAAFLFNFARYVEWPVETFETRNQAIRICMVGETDFAAVVARTVSGKNVADRPLAVDVLSDLSRVTGCHILYVGSGVEVSAGDLATSVESGSVFTVSDRDGFAADGGVANFIRMENKVRFEINPTAAKRAGLKVSSRLLRLARLVE